MAYVLTASQFASGLQQNSAKLLNSLRYISTVSPFTIAGVRTQLETDQTQTFTDEAFRDFLSELYNLEIDNTALTLAERTTLNVIRAFLDPSPQLGCCGSDAPTLSNTAQQYIDRVGSATFEKEAQILLNDTVTCDVFDIQLSINTQVGSPAIVSAVNILPRLGCINNKNTFSFLWIDFASDPSGFVYDVEINLRNDVGGSIANLITTTTF